jgi:hypothetical protein
VGYTGKHLDEFHLDLEALTRGLVVVGQSGCGKSFFLARLLEEMVMKGRTEDRFLAIDANSDFRQGLKVVDLRVFEDKWLADLLSRTRAAPTREDEVRLAELASRTALETHPACLQARVFGTVESPFNLDWRELILDPRALTDYLSPGHKYFASYLWCLLWALSERKDHAGETETLRALAKGVWEMATSRRFSLDQITDPATQSALAIDLNELAESPEWRKTAADPGLPEELDKKRVSILETELLEKETARLRVVLSSLEYLWKLQVKEREAYLASRTPSASVAIPVAEKKKRPAWFVIVEEAHRLAAARPASPLAERVRDLLWQIASEGRKYGLYLILATQRPTKVAPGLLGECDNAVVMKMNSRADLEFLAKEMRILDVKLLEGTLHFQGKGNALAVGEAAGAAPNVVQFMTAPRRSAEGGGDLER